jgi:hypothetical protein
MVYFGNTTFYALYFHIVNNYESIKTIKLSYIMHDFDSEFYDLIKKLYYLKESPINLII